MERKPDQQLPQQDNSEAERKRIKDIIDQARQGVYLFGVGGAGVTLTELIPEPRYSPEIIIYLAVKVVSYVTMIRGGFIALATLTNMADFARTHIHPSSGITPHRHEITVPGHKHKQEDIIIPPAPIIPPPPTREEQVKEMWLHFMEENNIKSNYIKGLQELGLSTRTRNTLFRGAAPFTKTPLSVSGLRFFLKLGIPIKVSGIGSGIRAEIKDKVAPITYPGSIEDYQKLTQVEKDQMVKNGFTQIF